ncbi:MAG: flagellar type III secretion system protein FlhB [Pseudomonadota bacterium]
MAEESDKQSRTEEATPKRIMDAIEKGNTPVSREVSSCAAILAAAVILLGPLQFMTSNTTAPLSLLLERSSDIRISVAGDATALFSVVGYHVVLALSPVLLILVVVGLLASSSQGVPRAVAHRIKPDPKRLSIIKGWERLFGPQGRFEFGKALFKFGLASVVGTIAALSYEVHVINALSLDPRELPQTLAAISAQVLFTVGAFLAVLAVADWMWARYKWLHDLRMTKQEVKDEQKQMEGDPQVKARQRSIALNRNRRRMIAEIPKATVIITNPTHYAVALRYVREETPAPIVVGKGVDELALRIREIAESHDIPIVEDRSLARSLYAAVETDRQIPPEFFRAVAEIVLFLSSRPKPAPLPTPSIR